MRMLAYGNTSNATNEYVHMASSTSMEALKRFVKAIRVVFENMYSRQQTEQEINEAWGWPGIFTSLDCIHYE